MCQKISGGGWIFREMLRGIFRAGQIFQEIARETLKAGEIFREVFREILKSKISCEILYCFFWAFLEIWDGRLRSRPGRSKSRRP